MKIKFERLVSFFDVDWNEPDSETDTAIPDDDIVSPASCGRACFQPAMALPRNEQDSDNLHLENSFEDNGVSGATC